MDELKPGVKVVIFDRAPAHCVRHARVVSVFGGYSSRCERDAAAASKQYNTTAFIISGDDTTTDKPFGCWHRGKRLW